MTIPDPALDKLNVRESPGGKVIGTVPRGGTVNVIGKCGPKIAAGIAKPTGNGGGGTPGWCQIDDPMTGCVSANFLVAGANPAAGAAGLVAKKSKADFGGDWNTTVDGVPHTVTLTQQGQAVSGDYVGTDGTTGTLNGTLKGNVLRFSWIQGDGLTGVGKFVMSGDGGSFQGSFSLSGNPDQADGSWNSVRG